MLSILAPWEVLDAVSRLLVAGEVLATVLSCQDRGGTTGQAVDRTEPGDTAAGLERCGLAVQPQRRYAGIPRSNAPGARGWLAPLGQARGDAMCGETQQN